MDPIIQPSNSLMTNVEFQPAANVSQPEESFDEVLLKQYPVVENRTDPKEKTGGQAAANSAQPKGPSKPCHLKHPANAEESADPEGKTAEEFIPVNPLPISSTESSKNLGNSPQPVKNNLPGQPSDQEESIIQVQPLPLVLSLLEGVGNLEENNLSPTFGQAKSNPYATESLTVEDLASILGSKEDLLQTGSLLKGVPIPESGRSPQALENFDSAAGKIDLRNTRWEGRSSPLNDPPNSSAKVIPVRSQFADRAMQPEGTWTESELNPTWLTPKKVMATSLEPRSQILSEKVTDNGEAEDASSGGWKGNFLELKGPSFNLDLSLFPGIDEKLGILLGQNSKGGKFQVRSSNGEFSGSGNSSAEKNSWKLISGEENHPTPDPFAVNELLGNPKPPMTVQETGSHEKLQLFQTESLDLPQRIAEKLIWSIRNNREQIRLTLDPPQLGNLLIELHRDKEEIKATLWADNPKTKEILENNQFQLQKALEADGFKLEQYEVFVQKDMGSFQGNEESPVFQGRQSRKQLLGIEETELPPPLEILPGAILGTWGSKYIDRFI
jgi:hypothetical protein